MSKLIRSLFIVALFCSFQPLLAQIKMDVEVPRKVDISEDYFYLKFIINDIDVKNFAAPSLSDFDVLSGPSTTIRQSSSSFNGKTSHQEQTTIFTYVLAPKKKGTFTIGAASAIVGGKKISSSTVKVEISGDGTARERKKQQAEEHRIQRAGSKITEKDLYVKVVANRKKIYEQEPILLTYKFYAKTGVGLNNIGLHKKPDFQGFLSQEIPTREINLDVENIGGTVYRTGVIQQYVLFPQKTGKISVPGITFDCYVIQQDNSIDIMDAFFNGGGTITRTVQRKVENVDLEVLPLPSPRPSDFSGGVGEFSIEGDLIDKELKTNDVATYRITITGNGNLKLVSAPHLDFPKGFDAYSPKIKEETSVTTNGIEGKMIYDFTFVPRNVGDYTIPEVKMSYFDVQTENYKTISVPPVKVHVIQGERSNEEYERSQSLRNHDIRDIHILKSELVPADKFFEWGSWRYWAYYIVLFFIAMSVLYMIGRYQLSSSDVLTRKSRKAGKVASRRMAKAKELMEAKRPRDFYAEVSHVLQDYVTQKFKIEKGELNKSYIEELLYQNGVSSETVSMLIRLLDECDFAQYAPSEQVAGMDETYMHTVQVITDIEKSCKNRK